MVRWPSTVSKKHQSALDERQALSNVRFNPAYHHPPFTTLSASQYQLEMKRKARARIGSNTVEVSNSTTLVPPQPTVVDAVALGSDSVEASNGTAKIRGKEERYSWIRSASGTPIISPGPIPKGEGAVVGALRIHRYEEGTQVWVLDFIKGTSQRELRWNPAHQGVTHPTYDGHVLQVDGEKNPTWVTRNTLTTYMSRRRARGSDSVSAGAEGLRGGRESTAQAGGRSRV